MTSESQTVLDQLVQEIKSISTKLDTTIQKVSQLELKTEAISNSAPASGFCPGMVTTNHSLFGNPDLGFIQHPLNNFGT